MKNLLVFVFSITLIQNRSIAQTLTHQTNWWTPNGPVYAMTTDTLSNSLYIGGDFTYVGPINTNNGVALNLNTAEPILNSACPNAPVDVSIPDGNGGWYIGGHFTEVGSESRSFVAHIDGSGNHINTWNTVVNGRVYALSIFENTVYIGGSFTNVNGKARFNIAAVDATNGSLSTWGPFTNAIVRTMTINGKSLFIGGDFTKVSDQPRNRLAALDKSTGILLPWNPDVNSSVYDIEVLDSVVYVGGNFTSVSGQQRTYLAAIDTLHGGLYSFSPNLNGRVLSLSESNNTLYLAGEFTNVDGLVRKRLAAIDLFSSTVNSWNPNSNNTISAIVVNNNDVYVGGRFDSIGNRYIGKLSKINGLTGLVDTFWSPNPNNNVLSLSISDNQLYVGGDFTRLGGYTRNRLAAFNAKTGKATAWNPNADNIVYAIMLSENSVFVGGAFDKIGNKNCGHIASVNKHSGKLDSLWVANHNISAVQSIAVAKNKIYIGTGYRSNPVSGGGLMALNAKTGITDSSWNVLTNGSIYALMLSDDKLYVGGYFTTIAGNLINYLAALDTITGAAITSFNPNPNAPVHAIAKLGNNLVVGGRFSSIGMSNNYPTIAVIDKSTGLFSFKLPFASLGIENSIIVVKDTIFVGAEKYSESYRVIDSSSSRVYPLFKYCDRAINTVSALNGKWFVGGDFTSIGASQQIKYWPYLAVYEWEYEPVYVPKINFEENMFSVYPNPTSGSFTIKGKIGTNIQIFSLQGKVVYQGIMQMESIELSLQHKNLKGLFFIHFTDLKNIAVKKIVFE